MMVSGGGTIRITGNLNGRICMEGLILFGFGGMFVVYIAAPFLDSKMQKMNSRHLMILVVVLLIIYVGDSVCSMKYPNIGDGVTESSVRGKIQYCSIMQKDKELKQTEKFLYS